MTHLTPDQLRQHGEVVLARHLENDGMSDAELTQVLRQRRESLVTAAPDTHPLIHAEIAAINQYLEQQKPPAPTAQDVAVTTPSVGYTLATDQLQFNVDQARANLAHALTNPHERADRYRAALALAERELQEHLARPPGRDLEQFAEATTLRQRLNELPALRQQAIADGRLEEAEKLLAEEAAAQVRISELARPHIPAPVTES